MVSFRLGVKSDYRLIANLHAKSWQQNYRGTFSDHFLDYEVLNDRLNVWKVRLESPNKNQLVYLAEIEHSFVGFLFAYVDHDSTYGTLIDNLHVDSEFIGQRIGEELMIKAAKYLIKKEKESMYLWVLSNNLKAIKFYKRLGGIPIETINEFDIGDKEITKTRYHWPNVNLILNHFIG